MYIEKHHFSILSTLVEGAGSLHARVPWIFSFVLLLLTVRLAWGILRDNCASNVPTVPSPTLLSYFVTPYKWLYNARLLVTLGMELHGKYDRSFKVRGLSRWNVLITDPRLIEELKSLPRSIMCFRAALDDHIRTDYSFYAAAMTSNGLIVSVLKKYLGDQKSLARAFPVVKDEIRLGWEDHTPSELHDVASTDWVEVDVMPTLRATITRTVGCVFFGVDLARSNKFTTAMNEYVHHIVTSAVMIDSFPKLLQPLAAPWVYAWKKNYLATIKSFLRPVIEERRQKLRAFGTAWVERPYDAIQWLLEADPEADLETLVYRMIFLLSAAMHTSYHAMTYMFYDLTEHRHLQPLLRAELRKAKQGRPLTITSLTRCPLLDSMMKESTRVNGGDIGTVRRRCMQPYTFSDGTHVTVGTWVMVPGAAVHLRPSVYANPSTFDAYRFLNLRKVPGSTSGELENTHQFVQTSKDQLTFGHGALACPGRFFASLMLKTLIAELVDGFEWRWREGEQRPASWSAGISVYPGSAKVLFRRLPGGI